MRKFVSILIVCCIFIAGCEDYSSSPDVSNQQEIARSLEKSQPTPTDIEYSLERYNLIRRAYWVNGKQEKALALPCPVEKPLGYVVLMLEGVGVVGNYVVDGKVSSLNSFLTPDSEYYEHSAGQYSTTNRWLADVDGSYGENDDGIFFFTTDGKYIEWSGDYLYSDIPYVVEDPVLKVQQEVWE